MSEPRSPDVLMDADGDLPAFTRHSSGLPIVAQRVRCRMETLLGDWPLDETEGIDWLQILGQKPVNLAGVAAVVAREASGVPGVASVQDLTWAQVGSTATISMQINTAFGSLQLQVDPGGNAGNPSVTVGGVIGHSSTVAP